MDTLHVLKHPLDETVLDDLKPHAAAYSYLSDRDGRMLPLDLAGVPLDGRVEIRSFRGKRVLKEISFDPYIQEQLTDAKNYTGLIRLIPSPIPGFTEQTFAIFAKPPNPWPEESTPAYHQYVRDFEEAKEAYRLAHKRLFEMLEVNPLELVDAEQRPLKRAKVDS